MFKIGDKVKIIKEKIENEDFIKRNAEIIDDDFTIENVHLHEGEIKYSLKGIPTYKKWEGIGIYGKSVECTFVHRKDQLEKVENKIKTNKISRLSGSQKESIIEYHIENKELYFRISKSPINLTTIIKILLHETELYKYKYERISPFRLSRKYDTEIQGHIFTFDFIDMRTNEMQTYELLRTNKSMQIEGEFKIFIPDFLELCVERNILQRLENGYKVVKKLNEPMSYCTYLKAKPSEEELKRKGFIIPEKYEQHYDLFA